MSMRALPCFLLIAAIVSMLLCGPAFSYVVRDSDKVYIVDRNGERWDVTQAKSIGFDPHGFQYGIGRDAFRPLDDSSLSDDNFFASRDLRVIGVDDGDEAHAYSVKKLRSHEIANTTLGSEPIAVGY